MNDGKEWQDTLPEFLLEAEMLLTKSEECLSHLRQFRNDNDAIDCLKGSPLKLAEKADAMALSAISTFPRRLLSLFGNAQNPLQLHDEALKVLHDCLNLMAWQLELIDPKTGKLSLDENEQTALIATAIQQIPQIGLESPARQTLSHTA
ncbi:hypothetical protein [Pseudomonas mucidolens]|uniref:CheA signal transduction histidine kinase n=1 Tax=Pseudomonas mucidolens TaxID=46679 RepID=A0A1H2N0Z9_9PSED|nr:hypothetical protein [Pseudomonas mucidolens]SDU98755.1 hypothetical protein SAMN05216202_2720 [Pseudomonas mucidolens]SQH32897.1 putative CheA signal transduction histidine kinase [Pseudomonas mucidolens]